MTDLNLAEEGGTIFLFTINKIINSNILSKMCCLKKMISSV